ncbi:MAG TPA: hypothetical protein VNA11_05090, partial [Pseudonocardia sp.]|nr:hypothetical protein [Pseudonocardia sp.]
MPHVPARHVGRPRLLALLDAAEPGGLLLVSAPAGYGKTLLLAEWAARRPDRVAWLSLDDDDRVVRGEGEVAGTDLAELARQAQPRD